MNNRASVPMRLVLAAVLVGSGLLALPRSAESSDVTVFGPKKYTRNSGSPQATSDSFAAQRGIALLQITNGTADGLKRVTSGVITLNGTTRVLGPDSLKQSVFTLDVPIALGETNTLAVELRGGPGTFINLTIVQEASPGEPFYEAVPGHSRPDAAVTEVTLEPERCAPGDRVTIKATVTNLAAGITSRASLRFLVDEFEIARMPVPPLGAGTRTEMAAEWTPPGPGRHRVKVALAMPRASVDASAVNDVGTAVLRVSGDAGAAPEVVFPRIDFTPAFPSLGVPTVVTVRARNPGFADLHDLLVSARVDQEIAAAPATIASLPAGVETSVSFPWTPSTPGVHVIRIRATLPNSSPLPVREPDCAWAVIVPNDAAPNRALRARAVTAAASAPLPRDASPGEWASQGPHYILTSPTSAGQMTSISFCPLTDTIYASSFFGGVWKSPDGGLHWKPLTDAQPHPNVTSVAADTANSDIVYYSAGSEWLDHTTIYKSIDGGETWKVFADWPGKDIRKLFVQRTDLSEVLIYAATSAGILRLHTNDPYATSSAAADWVTILPGDIGDMAVLRPNPDVVFAVRYHGVTRKDAQGNDFTAAAPEGLWRTDKAMSATDEGDWQKVFQANMDDKYSLTVDLCRDKPQYVYAALRLPNVAQGNASVAPLEVHASADGGTTWNYAFTNKLDRDNYNPFIRVHPKNPGLVYNGGVRLWKNLLTVFAGQPLWVTRAVPDVHDDQHNLQFHYSGDFYFALGDGGVYKGLIDQANPAAFDQLSDRNSDLRTVLIYDFDLSQTSHELMIAGTQDNGTIKYIGPEETPAWLGIRNGDGLYSLIAPGDNWIMYSQLQGLLDTRQSHDAGAHWEVYANEDIVGLPETGGSGDVDTKFITVDPGNADHVLAQGSTVRESWDGGKTWAEPADFAKLRATSATAIRGDACRMLFYAGGSYYAATTGGQVWRSRPGFALDLVSDQPGTWPCRLAAPRGANAYSSVYALAGGPASERVRKMWLELTPSGAQWKSAPIATELPQKHAPSNTDIHFYSIEVDPQDDGIVYLGTDKGVFRGQSTASGAWRWAPYDKGLPLVKVNDLISIPSAKELRAATYGRGAWTVDVTQRSTAKITYPENGATFDSSQTIIVRGYGLEYGALVPAGKLHWRRNVKGYADSTEFGTGSSASVTLEPGDHTITLVAIDSLGLAAEDSIVIHVTSGGGGVPSARILSPESGSFFDPTAAIALKGQGTDPEDGELTGASLSWSSDRDGALGTGENLAVKLSMEGTEGVTVHRVTLTVADKDGHTSSDTIIVYVQILKY